MFLPPPMDYSRRSLGVTSGKEPASQCRRLKRCRFSPWVGKIPWRRVWQPTPASLPGESPGTWHTTVHGVAERDTAKRLSTTQHSVSVGLPWWLSSKGSACNTGDLGSTPGLGRSPGCGHSNPLQYSCLENSMDKRSKMGCSPQAHTIGHNWSE